MGQLLNLSSLTVIISYAPEVVMAWGDKLTIYIQWVTRIVQRVERPPMRDVRVTVRFGPETLAALGNALSPTSPSLSEACAVLEEALFTFPITNIQICLPEPNCRRAGRPKLWSPIFASAFPKMNARGRVGILTSVSNFSHFSHFPPPKLSLTPGTNLRTNL